MPKRPAADARKQAELGAGQPYDPKKAQNSPVVLRVKLIESGVGDKYHWATIEVLDVIKNMTKHEFSGQFQIAHYGWGHGLPEGVSTVYVTRHGPPQAEGKTLWKLSESIDKSQNNPGYTHKLKGTAQPSPAADANKSRR